jgi:hypothetical protein
MSDPVFALAEKWLSVPTEDQDPATTFAKAFKSEREQRAALEQRVHELAQRLNAKTHECESLAASQGVPVKQVRREPALQVFCSNPTCETKPLTIDVAPPDEAVPLWIRGMGWRVDEDGQHWCPKEGK